MALLPLRVFFGVTFLFAGIDKLISPSFFRTGDPASLGAQMDVFARTSPLGWLLRLAAPLAPEIGLLIAVAEIAIGLGALSGLAFRIAAAGGALLSLLLWLTASWATRPFYYGADLPYLAGWIVLAVAGHGGLFVPRRFLDGSTEPGRIPARQTASTGPSAAVGGGGEAPASPRRRAIVQAGVLGAMAVIVASLTAPLRFVLGGTGGTSQGGNPSPTPGASPPPTDAPTVAPNAGIPIAKVADVELSGSASFVVPFTAPAPLPVGDPGVIVRLADGTFVAFDALCTHQGCLVEWDAVDGILFCPCHGAEFDATADGAVITGPTDIPLARLPLTIDSATGTILLRT